MCKVHYRYKGVRPPKVLCEECWRQYIKTQDQRGWVAYAKEVCKGWKADTKRINETLRDKGA